MLDRMLSRREAERSFGFSRCVVVSAAVRAGLRNW